MKQQFLVILTWALILAIPTPVLAQTADLYKKGCDYYRAGHYKNALRCFSFVTRKRPKFWQAQYHLGHTYMKLGMPMEARAAYDACMQEHPDFKTYKSCQTAIKSIDLDTGRKEAARLAAESAAKNAGDGQPDDSTPKTVKKTAHDRLAEAQAERTRKRIKELTAKRDRILQEGRDAAARIRSEAHQRIAAIEANTNQFVQHSVSGRVRLGLTSAQRNAILAEADNRARAAISDAELRARGIRIPRSPD